MKKRKLKNKRKGENVIEVFLKVVKSNRSFRWYSNGIFMQNILNQIMKEHVAKCYKNK